MFFCLFAYFGLWLADELTVYMTKNIFGAHYLIYIYIYIYIYIHQNINFIKPLIETCWSLATITTQSNSKTCNCLKEKQCPINGSYLTHYTTITSHQENYTKLYKRIFETTFKKCYEVPTKIQSNIGHLKQIS